VRKTTWLRSIFFTLVGINAMLIALLIGKASIPINPSIPSMGKASNKPQQTVEYGMEKVGSERVKAEDGGYWIVEHYREYEYRIDAEKKYIEKHPTAKTENLRYWQAE
jgi:hypothetical protein